MTARTGEPVPQAPAGAELAEHEVLADARIRAVLERYVALSGADLREVGAHRYELRIPREDHAAFDGRGVVRIAFSVEALQDDPDAEMAIVGSAFVEQLISAVRRRGARHAHGLVPPTIAPAPESTPLPASVANGTAGTATARLSLHPVGRLTARVTLRAGAEVDERLVESSLFDLSTGAALAEDVAAACSARGEVGAVPNDGGHLAGGGDIARSAARPAAELVSMMLADLETRLRPVVEQRRTQSEHALAQELARLDRYYAALVEDAGTADARRAAEADRERRRSEEIRRHEVRAVVHPLQLAEWEVVSQRAEWPLTSADGHRASVVAQRVLLGEGRWGFACPTCGASSPATLLVCRHDHAGCTACATTCSVCATGFCRDHGIAACHVDGRPACDAHARSCRSCRRPYCTAHERTCATGDHPACAICISPCAHCGAPVCDEHAATTSEAAARGRRRLCPTCVRHCEGGRGEVVGPDEVERCTSCTRVVCERHQTRCAVDGQVHCSSHMRRTDRSRRLVCESDRAACAFEPHAVFAQDEVRPCVTCGTMACDAHAAPCAEDGRWHCLTHLLPLQDRPDAHACEAHRTVCHVDGSAFSLTGTAECPACTRRACARHRRECANCGRSVCATELPSGERHCATCRALAPVADPEDRLIQASLGALGSRGGRAREWRVARDASHAVVELDLGWTRRVVFAVRHGDSAPEVVMRHSILGSARGR